MQRAAVRPRTAPLAVAWALAGLTLLLACGIGTAAVQLRVLDLPQGSVNLGAVQLVAQVSSGVSCTRQQNPSCLLLRQPAGEQVYTIWLMTRPQADGQLASLRQLVAFELRDRARRTP
jgi:hypothetical protein